VDLGIAGKVRPAVVVSVRYHDEDHALIAVVPHTTAVRGGRFEIDLPARGLKQGVFNVQALQPVGPHRFERLIAALSDDQMQRLDAVVRNWLGGGE